MYKQILKNIENKIESNNMTLKTLEGLKKYLDLKTLSVRDLATFF